MRCMAMMRLKSHRRAKRNHDIYAMYTRPLIKMMLAWLKVYCVLSPPHSNQKRCAENGPIKRSWSVSLKMICWNFVLNLFFGHFVEFVSINLSDTDHEL